MENLSDEQDELKKICKRFSGSTTPLTQLREKLNVKNFVQLLNCFPDLQKSVAGCDAEFSGETILNMHQILIHFDDCENLSPFRAEEENSASSIKNDNKYYFPLPETSLESFLKSNSFSNHSDACRSTFSIKGQSGNIQKSTEIADEESNASDSDTSSFSDRCDCCQSNCSIKGLCKDIQKSTEITDENNSGAETLTFQCQHRETLKESLQTKPEAPETPIFFFKITTKLIVVTTVVIVSTLLAMKLASLNKLLT